MENLGREIVFPTVEQICEVNRRMIEEFGGFFSPPDNLNSASALEYVLAAIAGPVYGHDAYPELKDKATAIAHHIITRHVFHDGNKRTAVHMAWEFLRSNGVSVYLDSSIIELAETIAKGEAFYEDLLGWLHSHQEEA